jgi:hypothetical protein
VFSVTARVSDPPEAPVAGDNVNHGTELTAVQADGLATVPVNVNDPPDALAGADQAEPPLNENAGAGSPYWVTATTKVAEPALMVTLPTLAHSVVFGWAVMVSVSPVAPEAGDTANHATELIAPQVPWLVVTVPLIDNDPPKALVGANQVEPPLNDTEAATDAAAWVTSTRYVAEPAVNVT